MFKFFIIFLAFLTLIVTGCSFSDPEPEEIQEQLDMEHAQKNQEQDRQQKEEAEKLLAQEKKLKARTEQKTPEYFKPDQQDSDDASMIDKTNSGHMLDRFELILDEKTPFLTFKGFFDPSQFPHIKIFPRNSKTETSVLLPNTLINSFLLPEREITSFSEEGILNKMLLEEKITKKENKKIAFHVTLTISSSEEHILVLDTEKSDSRHLTFALKKPLVEKERDPFFEAMQMLSEQQKVGRKIVDLAPPTISDREAMLLHPVTALMSYRRIDQLNLTILNASPNPDSAQRLAALLDRQQKRKIEKRIGMRLKIVNISSVHEKTILPKTKIYFHANLMKEALILAQILPGEQVIEQMPEIRISKLATDVEIYVGKNFE